jgi:hypothetical protein
MITADKINLVSKEGERHANNLLSLMTVTTED